MYRKNLTFGLFASLCLSLFSMTGSAEASNDEQRIYRIELIIFERAIKQESLDPEHWPKNLTLEYPDHRKKLIHPSEARFELESSTSSQQADTEQNNYLEYLDDKAKTLTSQRKFLDRTRGFRTVFHETWLQSLYETDAAPALLMRGGNQFGDHYELEGSIKLSVSRYLHIETDLWLTSFVPNYGQASEHWPNLPSQNKQYLWQEQDPQQILENQINSEGSIELSFSSSEHKQFNSAYGTSDSLSSGSMANTSRYLIREIVTLRQKRKMKSNELHYIDHPRIGVLVKITPYEQPDSQQEPEA